MEQAMTAILIFIALCAIISSAESQCFGYSARQRREDEESFSKEEEELAQRRRELAEFWETKRRSSRP
jgi:hypothetical protein